MLGVARVGEDATPVFSAALRKLVAPITAEYQRVLISPHTRSAPVPEHIGCLDLAQEPEGSDLGEGENPP